MIEKFKKKPQTYLILFFTVLLILVFGVEFVYYKIKFPTPNKNKITKETSQNSNKQNKEKNTQLNSQKDIIKKPGGRKIEDENIVHKKPNNNNNDNTTNDDSGLTYEQIMQQIQNNENDKQNNVSQQNAFETNSNDGDYNNDQQNNETTNTTNSNDLKNSQNNNANTNTDTQITDTSSYNQEIFNNFHPSWQEYNELKQYLINNQNKSPLNQLSLLSEAEEKINKQKTLEQKTLKYLSAIEESDKELSKDTYDLISELKIVNQLHIEALNLGLKYIKNPLTLNKDKLNELDQQANTHYKKAKSIL